MSLPLLMLRELMNYKLRAVLFIAVLFSACMQVQIVYENRILVRDLDKLSQQHDKLEIDFRHMRLEERSLAEHSVIEKSAESALGMIRPAVDKHNLVDVQ